MKKMSSKLLSLALAVIMVLSTLCGVVTLEVGAEESIDGKITTVDFYTERVESIVAGDVITVDRTDGEDLSLLTVDASGVLYAVNGRVIANKLGDAYNVLNKEVNIVVVYDDANGYARYYVGDYIAYFDDGSEAICKVSNAGVESGVKVNDAIVADGYSCKVAEADGVFNYVGYQEHEGDDRIRILSCIDTVWYDSVGYEVEVYDAELKISAPVAVVEGGRVYASVIAEGVTVEAKATYGYEFFAPLVVDEISDAAIGSTIIVTPFAKAGDVIYKSGAVKFTVTASGYDVEENYDPSDDEPKPTVVVGNASGSVGDEVTVLVDMINNPELLSMALKITYDENALEWVSVNSGSAMNGFTFTAPSRLKSGANLQWFANDVAEIDGTILEFKFKIKEGTAYGDYTIAMACDEGNTFDGNNDVVTLGVVNGKITVEEPKPTVTVGTASGSAGKEVTVLVDVANNPELLSMALKITYDENALEWVSVNSGSAMSGFTFTAPSRLKSGANLQWFANDATEIDGTILELVFKIKSGVALGDYAISMACDEGNTFDGSNNVVELATVDGKVTVEKPKQFVSVGTASGVPGGEVTVLVEVADAPDLYEMVLEIEFDDTALTLTSVANGEATSEFEFAEPRRLRNGVAFEWYADTASSVNGTVLALTFTIAEDATAEEYVVSMICDPAGTIDADENEVELDSISGAVTLITDPIIMVGKVSGAAGDTVTVDVALANSPSLYEMVLKIEFDDTVLTLTSAVNGEAASAFDFTAPRRLRNGAAFEWYGDAPATANGTVLTLTFTIAADAEAGEYEVSLICDPAGTLDADEAEVDIPNISGSVKVTG